MSDPRADSADSGELEAAVVRLIHDVAMCCGCVNYNAYEATEALCAMLALDSEHARRGEVVRDPA